MRDKNFFRWLLKVNWSVPSFFVTKFVPHLASSESGNGYRLFHFFQSIKQNNFTKQQTTDTAKTDLFNLQIHLNFSFPTQVSWCLFSMKSPQPIYREREIIHSWHFVGTKATVSLNKYKSIVFIVTVFSPKWKSKMFPHIHIDDCHHHSLSVLKWPNSPGDYKQILLGIIY